MRGIAVVVLAACSNAHELPEPTQLDVNVTAFDVDGETVYWTTEFEGDLILKQRSPNSTGQVWRRSLDGRGASQILAGPDGIILAEGVTECTHLTWIHRDRSSEEMPLFDSTCRADLRDQLDGAVILSSDSQHLRRLALGSRTTEPWLALDNAFFGELARTETENFALIGTTTGIDLVRFPRSEPPVLRTLAANVGPDARSLVASRDYVYWFDAGGAGVPLQVIRAPRDISSPPEPIYATEVVGNNVPLEVQLSSIAWVEQPVWFLRDALWLGGYYQLHRLEADGTLTTFDPPYNPEWIVAYAGQLLVLTSDEFGRNRLLLQPLP